MPANIKKRQQNVNACKGVNNLTAQSCLGDDESLNNKEWADSMVKVLNTSKPKNKKTLVLSRAKNAIKKGDVDKTSKYGFEIDGEVIEEKSKNGVVDGSAKVCNNARLELRVKPSWKDIEHERTLRKVATRGVVLLFNTVRAQQKELHEELKKVGPLDSRKEAVLNNINKQKFLDVLMGERAKSEGGDSLVTGAQIRSKDVSSEHDSDSDDVKTPKWDVLREDFMTNKKLKHWDEDAEDITIGGEACNMTSSDCESNVGSEK